MRSGSINAFSSEKTLVKSEYLSGILTPLMSKKTIRVSLSEWIFGAKLKEATYTTKVSEFSSNAVLANFFLSMSSTCLAVGKASALV